MQIHLETKDTKMLADGDIELIIKLSILFPRVQRWKSKKLTAFSILPGSEDSAWAEC